jgi:hypothetical protein
VSEGVTNPRVPVPTLPTIPRSVDRSASDRQNTPLNRLSELMALAHSRGGIGPWEVAELARLRGMSPWAPLSVIIAKETR